MPRFVPRPKASESMSLPDAVNGSKPTIDPPYDGHRFDGAIGNGKGMVKYTVGRRSGAQNWQWL